MSRGMDAGARPTSRGSAARARTRTAASRAAARPAAPRAAARGIVSYSVVEVLGVDGRQVHGCIPSAGQAEAQHVCARVVAGRSARPRSFCCTSAHVTAWIDQASRAGSGLGQRARAPRRAVSTAPRDDRGELRRGSRPAAAYLRARAPCVRRARRASNPSASVSSTHVSSAARGDGAVGKRAAQPRVCGVGSCS